MRRTAILILTCLALVACDRNPGGSGEPITPPPRPTPAAETRPAPTATTASAGGLAWDAPAPFVSRPPENAMRAAEYQVRDHEEATLAVFYFGTGQGGDVQSNLDRWLGQLTQPDGRPTREVARIEQRRVNELPVTTVDATGTFVGRLGMADTAPERPGWRVLGAIVEGPQGPVFFKLTGPAAGVEAASDAFDRLVESVRPG
jgi:hypothetical protein